MPSPIGILLTNVGSPAAPTSSAVRSYLREFLADPMVVDAPRVPWWLVRNLIILPFRSPRSARLYREIWTEQGSPLVIFSTRLAAAVEVELRSRRDDVLRVDVGMRYGRPAIAAAVGRLAEAGCRRLLVLPLFPQESRTTVGTTVAAVERVVAASGSPLEWRTIRGYPAHSSYLRALAASAADAWRSRRSGHLVISFHGLPQRYVDAGDPYPQQCVATAEGLARELGLEREQWTLSYQSRFGREPWLLPSTTEVLAELAGRGLDGVDVICPGFAADCLETLEEIAIGARRAYESAGGSGFRYLPALNDRPDHASALADLIEVRIASWK